MLRNKTLPWLLILLLAGFLHPAEAVRANPPAMSAAQSGSVTAFDLILAMNTLRVSNGLPALIEDPIINAVAQSTAQTMAASQMSWHIGNVSGRIQAAGYGGGARVWATENFAVGTTMGIDQIMLAWADADHMRPATIAAYCHIGAGVAKAANGSTYYILQAAYTSANSCGEYTSSGGDTGSTGGGTVPQLIIPVKVATPDAGGKIFHVVEFGQSFWSIAIAYQITIADIEFWNNISRETKLQVGQRLFIPSSSTKGYATPTPVGMVVPNPPDEDGKIVHTVQSYQTLSTIAAAYQVTVDTILALNGLQIDWPLQISQKLLIDPGTVLSPLEKLTPSSDGNYYHTIQSGETLSGIAGLYDISLDSLMAWNGLTSDSIIRPEQKLLLPVTPPATRTPIPATATARPPEMTSPTFSPTPKPLPKTLVPTASALPLVSTPASIQPTTGLLFGFIFAIAGGVLFIVLLARKRPTSNDM